MEGKVRRGGKKNRKHGRQHRRASGQRQAIRTYNNALRSLNRERVKAGLPPVKVLPATFRAAKALKPKESKP
jgi:hypothetical protein